jgi:flagellar motor switch protein FliM
MSDQMIPENTPAETAGAEGTQPRQPIIHSCNFRYAGRLSNENARALTSLHEKFALHTTNALQVYLGASIHLRLVSLEQKGTQEYVAGLPANSFLMPCALNVLQSSLLMEMDAALVFPMIDLLLGGNAEIGEVTRDLTDIDEEIMESITGIIVKEIERSWRSLDMELSPSRCIRPATVSQIFPANEKLVMLMFEMEVAETTGHFTIVLPTSFVGFLLRHLKAAQEKKLLSLRRLPSPSLRDRMMDCKFTLASDITQMRVLVRDLVGLKPGNVLRLNTPVKTQGHLTVENVDIYQTSPVRSGPNKAAQVVARLLEPSIAFKD